ncbi:MAG: Cd2+/Zn2+-exporting ATPase [Kiritimatiellia bacterium]|jgi:Zn2+/Cd2+-exporting ATPase
MQAEKHGEEIGAHDHTHHTPLPWLFVGSALLLSSVFARWVYPDNPFGVELLTVIGAIVLAIPIFVTAIEDILHGHMHMDELIALGVMAAMVDQQFEAAGAISLFMLVANQIESRTARGAHKAIENLIKLTPSTAVRLNATGGEDSIAAMDLSPGDRIRVRPGENIPADGAIVLGVTTINEATITGESVPRDKTIDADVFAGTQNLTGMIEVEVKKVGKDTTLGMVKELILAAERTKLPIMKIVDRYARFYTPTILMLAIVVWFFTNDWNRVVALLIMACPCAFILATPTAMVAALSAAARHGVLFKNVVDLESASRIDAVIFDKTGTLTNGELGVVRVQPAEGVSKSELLRAGASAEQFSNHPAAQALCALAAEAGMELLPSEDFQEEAGRGVAAMVSGVKTYTGRATYLKEQGVDVPDADAEGLSVIHIATQERYLGWVGLRDQVREGARQALEDLRGLKMRRIAMITGDRASVAARVAAEIGGCDVQAECLPQEKAAYVEQIQRDGYQVAFVGDGVNDAPALAASDTGIAMGAAGSDVAIHSAKVALMNNELSRIPFIVKLSRASKSVIFQNLAIGFVFILVGFGLIGLGKLNGIMAAVMHNAGSLIIIFNSARLVRFGEEVEEEDWFEAFKAAPVSSK